MDRNLEQGRKCAEKRFPRLPRLPSPLAPSADWRGLRGGILLFFVAFGGCDGLPDTPIDQRFDQIQIGSPEFAAIRSLGAPYQIRWDYKDSRKILSVFFQDDKLSMMMAESYDEVVFPKIPEGTPMTEVTHWLGRPTSICYFYSLRLGTGSVCFRNRVVSEKVIVPPPPTP
jgi:hypothetical protein